MKLSFECHFEHGGILEANAIMQKSCGLVIIGEVKSNSISQGETVAIACDQEVPLSDSVLRIEQNFQKIENATTGMMVGICLPKTNKTDLLMYLKK